MCREEAQALMKLKPTFGKLGVRMSAIVKENVDSEISDFREFWGADIFMDADKAFYKFLGGGKVVQHSTAGFLASFANPWSQVNKNIARAKKAGISKHNLKGEGLITGGTLVVHGKSGNVEFMFSEKNIGDIAATEKLLEAAKTVSDAAAGVCSDDNSSSADAGKL